MPPRARPTVLLFDIDGTLIRTPAGRNALEASLWRRFGRRDSLTFRLDGMTDRLIMRTALEQLAPHLAGSALDAEIATLIGLYLEALATEAASPLSDFQIYPGVERLLDRAAERAQTAIGLGTGNVVRGAEIKLARVGLYHRFSFGGFGDDHIDRVELIRIGAERGARQLGVRRSECRVAIIGDTPRDVAAARAIGAESIGVATANYGVKELENAGATHVLKTLADENAADAVLEGSSG